MHFATLWALQDGGNDSSCNLSCGINSIHEKYMHIFFSVFIMKHFYLMRGMGWRLCLVTFVAMVLEFYIIMINVKNTMEMISTKTAVLNYCLIHWQPYLRQSWSRRVHDKSRVHIWRCNIGWVHWQTWIFGFSILFTVDFRFLVNLFFCILHQVECQKYCKLVIYILADTFYH